MITVSATTESAHRSITTESVERKSAHRSPSPWHRDLAVLDTISIPQITIAPVLNEVESKWWNLRKRYTITTRGHRMGEPHRVLRFWRKRSRDRALRGYLDARRRIHHRHDQVAGAS